MAKIRTKKAKISAKQHRVNAPAITQGQSVDPMDRANLDAHEIDTTTLLGYPIKLLYRDLVRSIAITLILVVLLLGIFVYFRYN
jgi:hypothetical protein